MLHQAQQQKEREIKLLDTWYYKLGIVVKYNIPDSNFHVAHMGPTWVLSVPGGPHVGHIKIAVWDDIEHNTKGQKLNFRLWTQKRQSRSHPYELAMEHLLIG